MDEKQELNLASIEPFRIDHLPPELLAEIFRCCDSAPPSERRVRDEPEPDLFADSSVDKNPKHVKNVSLVNTKWRTLALPILFKHAIWNITPSDQVEPIYFHDAITTFPILKFLMDNNLTTYVESFTMAVRSKLPDMFLAKNARGASNFSWDLLFKVLDPLRVTILGTPEVLTSLVSRMLFNGGRSLDLGKQLYHILSLDRKERAKPGTSLPALGNIRVEETPPHRIFTIRPWTHLLLNEGSSIRIYRNYEYFLHRPPSILGHLLGSEEAPNDVPLVPPSLTAMSYVAIFPLSSHFNTLVDHLPALDKLYVQIVPQNDILWDPVEMDHVSPADLWMERNSCYGHIMRQIIAHDAGELTSLPNNPSTGLYDISNEPPHNWSCLREFESGDAADEEAWELAVRWVEASGTGWRVEREGVFVKPGLDARTSYGTALPRQKMDGDSSPIDSLLSVIPDFSPW
ncbi:hypothetical protein QBC44DRAFT_311019 [Cladorrhinum sp. PSN332]|nr:hypothetical protein QBC44DRAFT_311019 [Cladorrhinum sp. PSN332]